MKDDDLRALATLGLLYVAVTGVSKGVSAVLRGSKARKESRLAHQQQEEREHKQAELARERQERREELHRQAEEARKNGHVVCPSCLAIDPRKLCCRCGRCMNCGFGEYYTDTCYSCDDGGGD